MVEAAWFSSSFKRKSIKDLQRAGTTARQRECFMECVNARKAASKPVSGVCVRGCVQGQGGEQTNTRRVRGDLRRASCSLQKQVGGGQGCAQRSSQLTQDPVPINSLL